MDTTPIRIVAQTAPYQEESKSNEPIFYIKKNQAFVVMVESTEADFRKLSWKGSVRLASSKDEPIKIPFECKSLFYFL